MRTGYLAQRLLSQCSTGKVIAVFDSSAYLEFGDGIVCLAATGLPEGPLMVPYRRPSALRVGEEIRLTTDQKTAWRPPDLLGWSLQSLERGLSSVVVKCEIQKLFECAARGVEADFSDWLECCMLGEFTATPASVARLVGLGPGLTPSGDDYLGGAMITLHALGQSDLAYALFASVDLALTNRISAAHLFAASEGAGAAPLHDALCDVMCGRTETMPHRFVGLGLMGHRSGRDAFAGCHIVLRTYFRIKMAQTAT